MAVRAMAAASWRGARPRREGSGPGAASGTGPGRWATLTAAALRSARGWGWWGSCGTHPFALVAEPVDDRPVGRAAQLDPVQWDQGAVHERLAPQRRAALAGVAAADGAVEDDRLGPVRWGGVAELPPPLIRVKRTRNARRSRHVWPAVRLEPAVAVGAGQAPCDEWIVQLDVGHI